MRPDEYKDVIKKLVFKDYETRKVCDLTTEELANILNERIKRNGKAFQKRFIELFYEEFVIKALLANTIYQKEGTIHTTISVGMINNLAKERALYLKGFYNLYKD